MNSVLRKQVGLLAGKTAKRRLTELRNTSRLPRAQHDFLSEHEEHYPDEDEEFDNLHKPMRLSWDEIFVEDMLGMGGFGSVCLVTCPKLRKEREREERAAANKRNGVDASVYDGMDGGESFNASFAMTADDSSMGGSMMLSYASTTTATGFQGMLDPNKYYACKSLSNKTIKQANVKGFLQAAADLVHEAFLLSHMTPHPNLVRLYGIPSGSIEDAFSGTDDNGSDLGYFLILEALGGGILSDKVYDWKQKQANLIREQNILKKRREQQEQMKRMREQGVPGPPTSPTLNSFLESPHNQKKSHTAKRWNNLMNAPFNENGSLIENIENVTANPLLFQIPSLEERLDIALQIASGMQHLHAHGIVFRDLKPHNVGLSIASPNSNSNTAPGTDQAQAPQTQHLTWRLFDFGLAREVPISAFSSISNSPRSTMVGGGGGIKNSKQHMQYQHSAASNTTATDPSVCYGKAGSLRYMAPETMGGRWLRSSKHHNSCCFATFGSDVYSFAIVLWELVGLTQFDKRYDNSPEEFESAVCDRGHRPSMEALDKAIEGDKGSVDEQPVAEAARRFRHENIRELVHACWREDYRQRPRFEVIVATLKEMIPHEGDLDDDDLDENTIATDNCLNESELDLGSTCFQQQQQKQPPQQYQFVPKPEFVPQPLSRKSSHSYMSGSGRNRRRLMRKHSARTLSSRSMLSATSMSNHSMVLEDVFELDTEHSNSAGSNRSSQHKNSRHSNQESLDDGDVDDSDDESMANDYSMGDSLMNESVITISNRGKSSSRYLEYCAEYNDDGGEEEEDDHHDHQAPHMLLDEHSTTTNLADGSNEDYHEVIDTRPSKQERGPPVRRPSSDSSLTMNSKCEPISGGKKSKKKKCKSRSAH